MIALGIDPGFSCFGWALVSVTVPSIIRMGVIRTAKADKKQRVLATEDNVERTRLIHRALRGLLDGDIMPSVVCAEAMSFPRSSSVAAKVALAWGVIVSSVEARGLPMLQCSPQECKRRVCGSKSASKGEVQFAVLKHFGNEAEGLLEGVPASLHEHAYDAAAMVLACSDSDVMRALRRAA